MRIFKSKSWNFMSKYSQSGIGLVEAVVATAILGVVILGLFSQQRLSTKNSQQNYSDNEINNLTKKVTSEIGILNICGLPENFGGKAPGTSVTSLQRSTGAPILPPNPLANVILQVGNTYGDGQGQVLVTGIDTRLNTPSEMILILSFKKKESGLVGKFMARTVKREIPLSIIQASGVITSCFGNYDLIIKTAIELACQGTGAIYDPAANPPYGTCTRQTTSIPVNGICPNGQVLTKVNPTTTKITGVEYTCSGLAQTCPSGKIVIGFNADGTPQCDLAYKPCVAGKVLVKNSSGSLVCSDLDCTTVTPVSAFNGFDANGTKICKQIPGPSTCGGGSNFASQVNTDGTVTCNAAYVNAGGCNPGEAIQGINSAGNINCVKWIQLPANCSPGYAIDGVDANGYVTCKLIRRPLACNGAQTSHTYQDCRNVGGTIQYAGSGNSMCMLPNCAAYGMTQCPGFGTTNTVACNDTSNTYYCDGFPPRSTRYTYGAGFGYVGGPGAVYCYGQYGYPGTGHGCYQTGSPTVGIGQGWVNMGCY